MQAPISYVRVYITNKQFMGNHQLHKSRGTEMRNYVKGEQADKNNYKTKNAFLVTASICWLFPW